MVSVLTGRLALFVGDAETWTTAVLPVVGRLGVTGALVVGFVVVALALLVGFILLLVKLVLCQGSKSLALLQNSGGFSFCDKKLMIPARYCPAF